MRINHELINISRLSKLIGLSQTALHGKLRGQNYQKITPENELKIKKQFFEMILYLFEIETKEDFSKFIVQLQNFIDE